MFVLIVLASVFAYAYYFYYYCVDISRTIEWSEEEVDTLEELEENERIVERLVRKPPNEEDKTEYKEYLLTEYPDLRALCCSTSREEGSFLGRRKRPLWRKKQRASKAIALHLRAKFGLMKDSPANRQILKREALLVCKDKDVRRCDMIRVCPMAVEYALTPTVEDIEAAEYRVDRRVKRAKSLASPEN